MEKELQWVADFCGANLLDEKWLLAPDMRVANQWKERICFAGSATVNLRSKTIHAIVMQLTADRLAAMDRDFASATVCRLLVRRVVDDLSQAKKLTYFQESASLDKLSDLVARSIQQFRLAGLTDADLAIEHFEVAAKRDDFVHLLAGYQDLLNQNRLVDYADCVRYLIENPDALDEGPDVQILIPAELDLSRLEQLLLSAFQQRNLVCRPPIVGRAAAEAEPGSASSKGPNIFAALGEVNEIRGVLWRLLSNNQRLDTCEILHTDYPTYVPLVHEFFSQLDWDDANVEALPVTFAEGIACVYSRPGRALRSWIRWLNNDCLQALLVRMVREGLLQFDSDFGFARHADVLRRIAIGFGKQRYLPKLDEAIRTAQQNIREAAKSDEPEAERRHDFGLEVLNQTRQTIARVINRSPERAASTTEVLQAARSFLRDVVRSRSHLDNLSRQKLVDDIDRMLEGVRYSSHLQVDVWQWLEDLPTESHVLASGPRPGRLHVAHVLSGGHSGRPNTFVVGLDDARFSGPWKQDPLLLDLERERISEHLPTSKQRWAIALQRFRDLPHGDQTTFSFSVRSLTQDKPLFPSPVLLDMVQSLADDDVAAPDLLDRIDDPESFATLQAERLISQDEWWMANQFVDADANSRRQRLETQFPHLRSAREAMECVASSEFTAHDGLVPAAVDGLDPTHDSARRVSPSRLETHGACPRRYFFRYGLDIHPPDELIVDPDRWLEPFVIGNLVHDLFEQFLAGLTADGLIPELSRDREPLLNLLADKIKRLAEDYPIPNEDAFQRQRRDLEKACEIFLRKEQEYCRDNRAVPWVLEASVGLNETPKSSIESAHPVEIRLSDGRRLRVGGRIDRIDRMAATDQRSATSLAIWDYKSGSAYGFDAGDPFRQGRKLQPFLYVGMLRHRVSESANSEMSVRQFGYFFPSPRAQGLRISWTADELAGGDEILRNICDLIAAGAFPPTSDANDCRFCEYLPICGDARATAENSLSMLHCSDNHLLEPMRRLRSIECEEGDLSNE